MLEAMIDRFGYRRGQTQLAEVSVSLTAGRTVLLGPNGAGKTTLLKSLAGVEGFEGRLLLDGVAVATRRRRPAQFRRAVGWLPQAIVPFPGLTARENVAYVGWLKGMPTKVAWKESFDALAAVGLDRRAKEPAHRLSGGQTRRLGIAAILVHGPEYLLLDEPTAGLDPRERERLLQVLSAIEGEHATLVSTHDTDTLLNDTCFVHVLADGATAFAGTYSAFVAPYLDLPPGERAGRAYAALVPAD